MHTSTFAGAPLACAAALETLAVLRRDRLDERSAELGAWLRGALGGIGALRGRVSGAGLMVAVHVPSALGDSAAWMSRLRSAGFLVSTGGGARQCLVLTPPLTVERHDLESFVECLARLLEATGAAEET